MLAPLSWLKEYVDITLKPKELGDRLTEIGLGTEKILSVNNDTIFELEITPNRPDCLSMIGIAREIAAIEEKKIKYPKLKTDLKPSKKIPLEIATDTTINPRFTGIIIDAVTVRESPEWLKKRLASIGQRPINNIVDITNYVMFELGNPLHAFDYHKIKGAKMTVRQAKGEEEFKSVDGISYCLPKGAVVISDNQHIIDLCGIKGGYNSGTFEDTKTVFIRVPVEIPTLIRRASQSLGLRSEASSIFERGVNAGGTVEALKRCVDLILQLAGGEIASELYNLKKDNFESWNVNLRIERLNKILGIEIPREKVIKILSSLNLSPKLTKEIIEVNIPTYRNDLKIEEDIIEEVARLYGYNNFPKTIPYGGIPTQTVPYFKDYRLDEKVKELLTATGFSEIYTYSLINEADLIKAGFNPNQTLRVDNPVSRDFEYLRPTLKANLKTALKLNKPNFKEINLFELGKVYLGRSLDIAEEPYYLSGITNSKKFYDVKGMLEKLFCELELKDDPAQYIEITDEGIVFELNISYIYNNREQKKTSKKFISIAKYPPIMEDLALIVHEKVKTGDILAEIKKQSPLIIEVSVLDIFKNTKTFHIIYQNRQRNLTTEEVSKIREKMLMALSEKFKIKRKE